MSEPVVPLTLEGAAVLHQMFRIRWDEWRALDAHSRHVALEEAREWLQTKEGAEGGEQSAAYAMLGHKGDFLLLHFRRDFAGLLEAEQAVRQARIGRYLEPTNSFLSVVELGLYESTRKIYEELQAQGLAPGSEAWEAAVKETLERQRKAMAPRLWPEIPESRYLCFYPMDRRRGEIKNWYQVPFADRQRMMHEHGLVGRKYAGTVRQIISGAIGFDDWEWGVDLFSDDPLEFKRLIYEMRFDEVSAAYALFGPFYIGIRVPSEKMDALMRGDVRGSIG
ncbi:MAG: hydrogen peroxide-dependent heme synthase [Bryobacteraceae bacterium]